MFHAPTGCSTYRTTYRRMFHGDAPSRGRHRLWGLKDHSNPGDPSNRNGPNAPSDLSKLGSRRDFGNPSAPSAPSNQ